MNKLIKSYIKKSIAFVLLFTMTVPAPLSCLPVSAAEEIDAESAIHLSTAKDFADFAESCSTDSWSQNRVFVLDKDIDLSGTDFSPVPTFGGIFLGQGHTISGFSIEGGSNNMGLFRYIQKDGQVCGLLVAGAAHTESSHSGLALLAGCNYGVISGCQTSGNVTGGDQVGSIAGVNEVSGVIIDCTSNGVVTGSHQTGGIAGDNKGSITNSVNHSHVNTSAAKNSINLSSIDVDTSLTDILTTENAASVTDIGGIAGSNSGVIRACVNDGSTGYQHVGYNIGGIAGSQSGYIEGCVNYGLLNGRKDVGGIAGQMEPSSELEFSEDTLAKLDREFDKLHDLLTQLDRDTSGASTNLTGQIDNLLDSVEDAQNAVDQILVDAGSHVEDFSGLTDLTGLPSPKPVSLDFLDEISIPTISPRPIESLMPFPIPTVIPTPAVTPTATPEATPSATPGTTPSPAPTVAPTGSPTTSSITLSAVPGATPTILPEITPAYRDMPILKEQGGFVSKRLSAAPAKLAHILKASEIDSPGSVIDNPETPSDDDGGGDGDGDSGNDGNGDTADPAPSTSPTATPAPGFPSFSPGDLPELPIPSGGLNLDDLQFDFDIDIDREKVEDDINKVQDNVYQDISDVLEGIQNTVQEQASILSSRIFSAQSSLNSSFTGIVDDTRLLNSMLDDENQIILDDFQAIIDQINVITDLITNPETTDPDDILTDISDEDKITDTAGKVMNCENHGTVNGDLNVGGIAGSLSKENNLDPENDFDLDRNSVTLNFRYKERIVVRQCRNDGAVEGKKNRIGGIAGEMLLGSIMECTNQGRIAGEGNMIGGIAGYSASTVRASSSKCALSGIDQVGGIAGYGTAISDCYSMVEIQDGENYLGSIAGEADPDSSIGNNFFVEGCPAGIDGISYEGQAQPLAYEEFLALPDLPDIFRSISLTFVADDKTVGVITLNYGDSLNPIRLPAVPVREGYVGTWADFDSSSITFDQTIEALYTEYIATLESPQTVNDRPVALVEGCFTPYDGFTLSQVKAYPDDAQTRAECWKIAISAADSGPYTVRYLIPGDMENPVIELYDDNVWIPVDTLRDGSYYVFTSDASEIIFSCVDRPDSFSTGTVITLTICAAMLMVILLIMIRARRKRNIH